MKKNTGGTLYFIAGFLFIITSIIYIATDKTLFGITYIGLAISFTSLGFSHRKAAKKS